MLNVYNTEMTKNIVIVGAGGVAAATARKCAQHNDLFGDIVVASRRAEPAESVADSARPYRQDGARKIGFAQADARNVDALAKIISDHRAFAVLNAASPHVNLHVMDAALAAGAHYLDTAVYETEGATEAPPPPWYAEHEWQKRDAFARAKRTGVLSIGFDPGAVNVFCARIRDELLDTIDSIDIMDVNAGDHGRFFATNFDPETNLREIREEVMYWHDGKFETCAPHSRSLQFDFPEIGKRRVFLMGHEELHSLPSFVQAPRIAFWMGFSERYLRVFGVLNKLGLLSPTPVAIEDGVQVSPIKVIKALLPDPQSLAQQYRGKACIGVLARGVKDGKPRAVFVYSMLSHEEAFADIGVQAVAYSTAVPLAAAASLVFSGEWQTGKLQHPEQLPSAPFLQRMTEMGIGWQERDESPDLQLEVCRHDDNNPPVQL